MVDGNFSKKRWYDQQQTVSKSVALVESFPTEFQIVLGESIIELAENQCRVNELMAQLRSLGPEKVLNLFKSKSKRRAYDEQQEVHQAMNYMYILPDDDRIYIASHIIALVDYFFEYFKICKEERVQPSINITRQVSKAYLQGDLTDPNIFLTIVRKQIQISTHYSFQYVSQSLMEDADLSAESADIVGIVDVLYEEKLNAERHGMIVRRERLD